MLGSDRSKLVNQFERMNVKNFEFNVINFGKRTFVKKVDQLIFWLTIYFTDCIL